MSIIKSTNTNQLRYTLAPKNIEMVYQKLVKALPAELASVFLNPRKTPSGIEWSFVGKDISIYSVNSYNTLSETEQNYLSQKLVDLKTELVKYLSKVPELNGVIDKILEIPSIDAALLLKTNKGDLVALVNWGHQHFDSSNQANPLIKIINKPKPNLPVTLSFKYSDTSLFTNQEVQINIVNSLNYNISKNTGEEAIVNLGTLPINSSIEVVCTNQGVETIQSFSTNDIQNVYEVIIPAITTVQINIKDQKGKAVSNFNINTNYQGVNQSFTSNSEGKIFINNLAVGEQLSISDVEKQEVVATHKLSREPNPNIIELTTYIVPPPVIEYLKFYVYDYDKDLIQNAEVEIIQKEQTIQLEHDGTGKHTALRQNFALDQNKKSTLKGTYNYKGKTKKFKSNFHITENNNEYHVYLKRNFWPFLLLLIPILLLLLLSFEKSMVVKVTDYNGKQLANASVEMEYQYASLFNFDDIGFFTTTEYQKQNISNANGVTTFAPLKYTVYDLVFYFFRKASFKVETADNCLNNNKIYRYFYTFKDTMQLNVLPKYTDLDLLVVDKRTNRPIPDADVEFIARYDGGNNEILKGKTNGNGIITFPNTLYCAELEQANASKQNYLPDTINNQQIPDIIANIDKGTLYLENTAIPCDNVLDSGGYGGITIPLSLPQKDEEYIILYNFYSVKDRLKIWKGKSSKGAPIFDTGFTSGINSISIIPKDFCNSCDFITIQIDAPDTNTDWDLEFICP